MLVSFDERGVNDGRSGPAASAFEAGQRGDG
jgi:hypothetical protein